MQETWVQSLNLEEALEKQMTIHSSIPAWEIPWTEKTGLAIVQGVAKSQTWLSTQTTNNWSRMTSSFPEEDRVQWQIKFDNSSLEGLMLKLKLQYFGHLMRRADSFERPWSWERLKAGGEGDDRGWDGWMASLTQRTWVWVNSASRWWTERPGVLQFMGSQTVGHDRVTELNWGYFYTIRSRGYGLCCILPMGKLSF